MLLNYIKLAFRTFRKHKGYTAINTIGLGMGIAASLLIVLYATHELTYDRFHEEADQIYYVYKERVTPAGTQMAYDTWVPMAQALERDITGVADGIRMWDRGQWVQQDTKRFQERVVFTDANVFAVFSLPFVYGDPATAFDQPQSVVLSATMAEKYFGLTNPIGQHLTIDNTLDYTVTGVLEDLPTNSSLSIDFAVPFVSFPDYAEVENEWGGSFIATYVRLDDQATQAAVEAQFPAFIARTWDEEVAARTNLGLIPLPDFYHVLTDNRQNAFILLGIAVAIMLIASINFMNLATARSLERAREIAMRKVLGARRPQLAVQFLGESMLMSTFALVLGISIVELALPFFNALYGLRLELAYWSDVRTIPALLGVGMLVGFLSGTYPALVLSGFRPITSLKGALKSNRKGIRLRHGMVIAQFAIAIVLIIGTLVASRQIQFMQEANLNFNKENLVTVTVNQGDYADPEAAAVRLQSFKETLRGQSGIVSVSSSSHIPGAWPGWFTFAFPENWGDRDPLRLRRAFMDAHFFETYGIHFLEGRPFDEDRPADRDDAVIINEATLRAIGWTEGVGKTIRSGGNDFTIVGVIEDYNFQSLQNEIAPILHFYRPPDNGVHRFITVRLQPGTTATAIADIQQHWSMLDTDRAMPYTFVTDTFAQLYEAEQRMTTIAGAFAMLAILVACMGLFGLSALMVTQRIKEIGVRKVLGASVAGIIGLLSLTFARLVGMAFLLAAPLGYLIMQNWLDGFAYHIDIPWLLFLVAGTIALVIACLTVSIQASRAARINPVDALRYE